jgi:hypothetical protein
VEVGTQGVKALVESVAAIDALKRVAAATAETVAQTTIPDQPDKEAKVARQVRMVLDAITLWLAEEPRRPVSVLYSRLRHPSRSAALRDADPELADTYYRLMEALSQLSDAEEEP